MEQNYTPLPAKFKEKGAPISLKYIVGSFIIFFLVGASILAGIFYILKKNVSEPTSNINSQMVTPTTSPTATPTPKSFITATEKEMKDAGLPETYSIGSIEADLSDLQKDLNSL